MVCWIRDIIRNIQFCSCYICNNRNIHRITSWHGNIFALLALCKGNHWSQVLHKRPALMFFFDISMNKLLNRPTSCRCFLNAMTLMLRHRGVFFFQGNPKLETNALPCAILFRRNWDLSLVSLKHHPWLSTIRFCHTVNEMFYYNYWKFPKVVIHSHAWANIQIW